MKMRFSKIVVFMLATLVMCLIYENRLLDARLSCKLSECDSLVQRNGLLTLKVEQLENRVWDLESNVNRVKKVIGRYKADIDPKTLNRILMDAAYLYDGITVEEILALVEIESGFQTSAVSSVGAMGLMQIKPGTAKEEAEFLGYPRKIDLGNPRTNIMLGSAHLNRLVSLREYRWTAITDYNVGRYRWNKPARARYWAKYTRALNRLKEG